MTSHALTAPVNDGPPVEFTLAKYLGELESPTALKNQNRLAGAYDAACQALLGPNDIQVEGGRSFKKKSAWRKLARRFDVSTEVVERNERYLLNTATGESIFLATCTVRGTAPWGQSADAVGACGTDEETGRRKITVADAIATAETRATNRAISNLIAMGEVSAEETTREERREERARPRTPMTLAEARAVIYPWPQPPKYRDQPLSALSLNHISRVLAAVQKEIADKGATERRLELQEAAQLVKDNFPAAEPTEAPANGTAEPETSTAPSETAPERPEPADPSVAVNTTIRKMELNASIIRLIAHPALTPSARSSFQAWHASATTEQGKLELIHALESSIESHQTFDRETDGESQGPDQ